MSYIEENGYFIFGGVKSSDYGVWISGGGTFNAPARRYKEYVVPGRNGTLTIDEGAYEEAEVTYPAFIARDFPANVEAFRNAIMAQNGYVRMTDSYHPDEYYLARYMAGLEVDTLPAGRGGSFELTFRRDPRRFLLSGEEPVTYPPGVSEGGKNLLPYPYTYGERTDHGVTFTPHSDGTITVNGTASTGTATYLIRTEILALTNNERYVLSGCPSGGTGFKLTAVRSNYVVIDDNGEGIEFTNYTSTPVNTVRIQVDIGKTVSNLTFKPMIRKASDAPGWEPYYDGSKTIKNPTLFPSKPLIRVTGAGTVGIGDETITIASGYDYVDIDSEIQNCYCGNQNANAAVTFSNREFPELQPGLNGVTFGTGIESVQITPRWYRI